MTALVHDILREHRNIAKVLDVLEREVEAFETGERFDGDLWRLILEYLGSFPEEVHHPKEDLIYRRLMKVHPDAASALQDLEAEHARLAATTRRLAGLVDAVERDRELPRRLVAVAARDLLGFQRAHMAKEEESFLPYAESHLKPEDWEIVAMQASAAADPLFDQREAKRFADLRDLIFASE